MGTILKKKPRRPLFSGEQTDQHIGCRSQEPDNWKAKRQSARQSLLLQSHLSSPNPPISTTTTRRDGKGEKIKSGNLTCKSGYGKEDEGHISVDCGVCTSCCGFPCGGPVYEIMSVTGSEGCEMGCIDVSVRVR